MSIVSKIAVKAPILYDEFAGEIDVDHLFRNPLLLNIHACILRGADGPTDLFKDNPYRPQAPYMEKIHNITRTSTGAIANAAVLAIWLYSADTKFLERGNETNINYRKRYRQYVEELRKGLTAKKAWVDALLNYWDGVSFPDADDDDGAANPPCRIFLCYFNGNGNDNGHREHREQDSGSATPLRPQRGDSASSPSTNPPARRTRRRTEEPDSDADGPPRTRRRTTGPDHTPEPSSRAPKRRVAPRR
ncbi:hypothetical protein R3P38DRAFT_3242892 [Favolaschia claudopus]|uniref:Uncharacterized protein n=1 Tax=Favolaschia claudopus TaxID=2862362 RepID=A0AAV9Z3Q4_9AGAR